MEHFVTIFNKNYLPQGLCLYDSLKKNYTNFEINEFAIKPITSRFSLLHHRTMEIWIFQPNAAQV